MPERFGRQLAKAALVVAGYLVCVALAIAFSENDEHFLPTGSWLGIPGDSQILAYTIIYGLAAPFALAFGILVRPFWRGVVLVIGLICFSQIAFSVVVTAVRGLHLAAWQGQILATLQAEPRLDGIGHSFEDDNDDGLIDRIVVTATLDRDDLPAGTYDLRVILSQSDAPNRQHNVENLDLVLKPMLNRLVPITAEFNPSSLREEAEAETIDLEVSLELRRFMRLSETDRFILMLCEWATAPCPTPLTGNDPDFSSEVLELAHYDTVHRLALAPAEIQRKQVIVTGFLGDFGRDRDGDGQFDELVVELAVDSIYDGPLFFQGRLEGFEPPFISHETAIAPGQTSLELVIDGAQLKASGRDGPYRVHTFVILNNSPYCPQLPCEHKHQPIWTIYLPDYETKAYRAAQFQ